MKFIFILWKGDISKYNSSWWVYLGSMKSLHIGLGPLICVVLIYILLSNIKFLILIFQYLMFIKKIIRENFLFFWSFCFLFYDLYVSDIYSILNIIYVYYNLTTVVRPATVVRLSPVPHTRSPCMVLCTLCVNKCEAYTCSWFLHTLHCS